MRAELLRDTLSALAAPRRAVPIALVGAPMVLAQWWFLHDLEAVALGVVMLAAFVAIAPVSWRALFPVGVPHTHRALRLLAYAALGAVVVLGIGYGFRLGLGVGKTFLSSDPSLAIVLAMFWAGGWGLGRDIDFERGLDRERRRAEALAREAERAELMAIRSHLDPHFLFNTLNAIAEWCREDGEVAERALLDLSRMLRTVLGAVREPEWALERELGLVASLVDLYRIRDPERFRLERRGWEDVAGVAVPPMLLLSLVENAVKHGPAAGHRGAVRVSVERAEGAGGAHGVRVTVENPGRFTGPREGGQGLDLVRRRLAIAYGGEARFTIAAVDDGTRAELILPATAPGGAP